MFSTSYAQVAREASLHTRASRSFLNFPTRLFDTPPYEKRKDPYDTPYANGRPFLAPLRIRAGIFEMPHRVLCQRVCVCLMAGSGTQGQGHGQRGHGHRDKDTIDRDTLDKLWDMDNAAMASRPPHTYAAVCYRDPLDTLLVSPCPAVPLVPVVPTTDK